MNSDNSITQYIEGLKREDEFAAQKIWQRFFQRLIALADKKLKASPRKAMNEEDVVQNAFAEFFRQVKQGRFPKLNDRHDLWQILAMLVDRRAKDQIRKQNSRKAGAGLVHTESIFLAVDDSIYGQGLASIPDVGPTPELAAELTALFRQRLAMLDKPDHRQVALLKMQGFTNEEIAKQIKSSLRTVERWLDRIRKSWGAEISNE